MTGRLVMLDEVAVVHPQPARHCPCRGTAAIRESKDSATGHMCQRAKDRFLRLFADKVGPSPAGPRWEPGSAPEESIDTSIRMAYA